jgi:hypothetical protein
VPIEKCRFNGCRPRIWHGRYSRILGDNSVFHLRHVDGRLWPVIQWDTEDGLAKCGATKCNAAGQLVNSVERAKREAGGTGAGSFIVNEFGQVIVPASDGGGRRYLVGELDGPLLFNNPFDEDDVIDLSDCKRLARGDAWARPYVGVPYNLSGRSKIYFYQLDKDGGHSAYPPRQDTNLIAALRSIRRSGPVRFIVNPAGLVLTKRPSGQNWSPEEDWKPVFVGRIDRNVWFEKE